MAHDGLTPGAHSSAAESRLPCSSLYYVSGCRSETGSEARQIKIMRYEINGPSESDKSESSIRARDGSIDESIDVSKAASGGAVVGTEFGRAVAAFLHGLHLAAALAVFSLSFQIICTANSVTMRQCTSVKSARLPISLRFRFARTSFNVEFSFYLITDRV